MTIFIDSDVLIDLTLERSFPDSDKLFKTIENSKQLLAVTTAIVLVNVHYITAAASNPSKARRQISTIRRLVNVISTNQKHIDKALSSKFPDLEDAVQYYAARDKVDYIITRNKKDYKYSKLPVLTPAEFLASRV